MLYNMCMKVNFGQRVEPEQQTESKGRTSIAAHLIKESVILDINNNQVDLRKNVIKRAGQDE